MRFEADWAGAEQGYLRAIALDARNATAHYRLALLQGFSGRFDEALAEMEMARQLEPLWAPAAANYAWLLVLAGRYTEGEAEARRAIEIDPAFAHSRSALGRALRDKVATTKRSRRSGAARHPGPGSYADVVVALASRAVSTRRGRSSTASSRFRGSATCPAYDIAIGHAALGDADCASAWLDKIGGRRGTMQSIAVDPALAALRENRRFRAIVKRAGVPDTVWSGRASADEHAESPGFSDA